MITETSRRLLCYLRTAILSGDFKCLLLVYNIGNNFVIDVYTRKLLTSVRTLAPKKHKFYCNKQYWTTSSSLTFAEIIVQLNIVSQAHTKDIVSHAADKSENQGEETGSNCSALEMFYNNGGFASVKSIWSFTINEFETIWMIMLGSVSSKWNIRRGRITSLCTIYMSFIFLCVLNYDQQWEITTKMLRMSCCTIERKAKTF